MERMYVSTKAICWGSVELASLNKKEKKKENSISTNLLVQDVDDHFEGNFTHNGRESQVDSCGKH